jgi:hypothetical protein
MPTTQEKKAAKSTLTVSFNGMEVEIDYNPNQSAEAIHAKALNSFGIKGDERGNNFLFMSDNQTEIDLSQKIGAQVEPGSRLYLRPRNAGGG